MQGKLSIDNILADYIGPHGVWQLLILFFAVTGLPPYEVFSVFGNSKPHVRCRLDDHMEHILSNVTFDVAKSFLHRWVDPDQIEGLGDGSYQAECYHYVSNQVNWSTISIDDILDSRQDGPNSTMFTSEPTYCSNGYVYHPRKDQYPSSVIQSFDLVCDLAWVDPFSTTLLMIGMLFGYYLGGWSGDRFGRRPTVIFWYCLGTITGVLASFSPNGFAFCCARFVLGMADSARLTVLFVLLLELTTPRWRSLMCSTWTVLQSFAARGSTSLLAYFLPNWRWLNFGITAIGFGGIGFLIIAPESPRWYLANGRIDDAVKVLVRGYRFNHFGKKIDPETFSSLEIPSDANVVGNQQTSNRLEGNFIIRMYFAIKSSPFWQLFRVREMVKRLFLGSFLFCSHIYCYYGVMLYANNIRASVYIVTLINASMALPGTFTSFLLYRLCLSRKKPLLSMYIIAFTVTLIGAVCTLTKIDPDDTVLTVTVGLTMALLEAAMDMIYVFIPELFPTIVRSQGLGFCGGFARFGAAMCSFTNVLDAQLGHGIPMVFYVSAIGIAIGIMLLLPDTQGCNLDNILNKETELERIDHSQQLIGSTISVHQGEEKHQQQTEHF